MMPDTHPLACLTCGYDLTGIESPRCPECGRSFTDQDRPSMARLRAILDRGDAIPWKYLGVWLLVAMVYAAGAEFMRGNDDMPALIIGAIVLPIACFGSFALGSVVLLGCERPKRLAAQDAWRRELWVLHFPWLVIAPVSVVFLASFFALKAAGLDLVATIWVGLTVLVVWLVCSLAAPFVFMRRARRRLAGTGADARLIRLRLWIAALIVLGGAMFLGLGGGMLARYGAAKMAGYVDPAPDGI